MHTTVIDSFSSSGGSIDENVESAKAAAGGARVLGSVGGSRRSSCHTHVEIQRSKFHFVDLAGSEKTNRTGKSITTDVNSILQELSI